ncbi:helix-turn-helix domain-containing protein [Amycolatopsis nigrescens]|uniref:helix-turn-helix domain-containing protein n=1 Tax=Amycolatopsis nigrescens TaxID=381445 RepID=UPI0009FEC933|nr:helix-turn-helix transcriptional regulator [Amycolatopsis nigrescens]
MTGPDDEQRHGDTELAEALRRLRKAANLSGERLAVRCAMSQSKISRIERGRILPTVVDVERILKALEVPSEVGRELVVLARRANVQHTSWRAAAEMGLWRKQTELKALAESSTVVRQFLPATASGLIQTEEYARYSLTPLIEGNPTRNVERAVQARIDSQKALQDEACAFHFLLTEQAVRWGRASPAVMARQCAHMAEVSERPNIQLAIIPWTASILPSPLNVFVVYDERLVLVELFSGEVALRDPLDVSYHLNLFDFFLSHALTGNDATAFLRSVSDEFM